MKQEVQTEKEKKIEPTAETEAKVSKKEKVALFAAYFAAEKQLFVAEKIAKEAEVRRSELLGEIANKCGRGPFRVGDEIITIATRRKTNMNFMRKTKASSIDVIE